MIYSLVQPLFSLNTSKSVKSGEKLLFPFSWKQLRGGLPPILWSFSKFRKMKSPCPFTENRAKIKTRNIWFTLQALPALGQLLRSEFQLFLATLECPFSFPWSEGEKKRSVKIMGKSGIQPPSATLHFPNSMLLNIPVP